MAELYTLKNYKGKKTFESNRLTPDNATAVALWCNGVEVKEYDALEHSKTFVAVNLDTEEGRARAQEGDWIVRRTHDGVFFVIKPRYFEVLFKLVR